MTTQPETAGSASRLAFFWDALGVMASLLCAAHCLLLPIALSFLSVVSGASADSEGEGWVHRAFAGIAILAAYFGLRTGVCRHRSQLVFVLGVLGSVLLVTASFASTAVLDETHETLVTLLGATLLTTAHVRNWRLLKAS